MKIFFSLWAIVLIVVQLNILVVTKLVVIQNEQILQKLPVAGKETKCLDPAQWWSGTTDKSMAKKTPVRKVKLWQQLVHLDGLLNAMK